MTADKWYQVPIASRVEPFLREQADRWYTAAAIAGWAHLAEWQVAEQLRPLLVEGKVLQETEDGRTYYRWAPAK